MNRHHLISAGAVATMLTVAACGGGSGNARRPPATSAGDRDFIAFTACMRRHGVAMSDPYHRPGHAGLTLALPPKLPSTLAAYGACMHLIAPVIAMKEAGAQQRITASTRLGLIRYAECMRTHGIAMLDPDSQGILNLGNVPGLGNGIGRYTPQFRAADHSCRHLLPASVPDNGTGP
jgi:hypothetical protein